MFHAASAARAIGSRDSEVAQAAGVCFARAQGCRDGRSYGAPTAVHEFASPDAREAWCERYLAAKRRRMRGR